MSICNRRAYPGIFNNPLTLTLSQKGRGKSEGERGISLIAVIIVMLLVATLSLVIASTMSSGNISSVADMQSQQAMYLAQAGMEWYLEQLDNDSDWSSAPTVKTDESFGAGTFSVSVANAATNSIDVTATGKVTGWNGNDVQRAITAHITKSLASGTSFADFAIYYGGGAGSIETEIKKEQTITGDIFINGDLDIKKDSTITGNVSATGEIDIHEDTNVSGTVTEFASAPATQPGLTTTYYDGLISTAATQSAGDRDFEAETISGIIYVNGDVGIDDYINGSGTIVATGEIEIKQNTDIGSDITLIASDELKMKKDGTVGTSVTFYSSSEIELKQGIVLGNGAGAGEGVIILSPGEIKLKKNITIAGFIFGDEVKIDGENLTLTGNLSGDELEKIKKGAVITKDNTLVDYASVEGFDPGVDIEMTTSSWKESL